MEVHVGTAPTSVFLWSSMTWPPDEWLEHAISMADGSLLVYDGGVRALPGTRLRELDRRPGSVASCCPGTGEEAKSWRGVEVVLDAAMERGLGRDGCIVGIGGGAVCDAAAFAASLFMRGVAVELMPTSLLAMVDASIGGKTAIDYRGYKNIVGTFHPARRIDVPLAALDSLPAREYSSGLGEVLKTGLLEGGPLLELLERERDAVLARAADVMEEVVRRCVAYKAAVVEDDPEESGRRAVLNLGHTFAHALESAVGPGTLTHGEAVAWGLSRALELGLRLGHTDPGYRARAAALLDRYGFARALPRLFPHGGAPAPRLILDAMRQDKKRRAGSLRFVLQRSAGDTHLVDGVSEADVLAVLSQEL